MFTNEFNPTAALAATSCPRCGHVGLLQIAHGEYLLVAREDRHEAKTIICPSLYGRCPVCRVVAEWPACQDR